jgi:hypothetical protein
MPLPLPGARLRGAGWSFGMFEKLPETYGHEAEAVKRKDE